MEIGRFILISDIVFQTLKEYWKKTKQQKWLFPGQNREKHIKVRTVQKIFAKACEKAIIKKNITVHSLRHSFATHLQESGLNLKYIQKLLCHSYSKIAEVYALSPYGLWVGKKLLWIFLK